ncbi:MAG: DNA polymerase Y family protein [Alphaproteobacteria bacterium]|nr:DNA polymerase Y family protein [Alphaproteobacteria bacterium]
MISLWLPKLASDRVTRQNPAWRSEPMAVVMASHGGIRLAAVNPAAATAGLESGLTPAAARAVVPGLETVEADPHRDAETLSRVADWCGRYTPWTAPEPLDTAANGAGVWLDITGCAHLFGGEENLLADLLRNIKRQGFHVRAALADTPGAAWALARFGQTAKPHEPEIVDPGSHRLALRKLPVAALRITAAVNEGLDRLGLRRIGDLYDLPRAPLVARFGEALTQRLDQALGRLAEPVSPRSPVTPYRVRLAFPEAIGHLDDVAAGLHRLLDRLRQRLVHDRLGLRRAELTLYRVDGGVARAVVGTSRPVRDVAHLERLFADRLDSLDLGFGVEVMTIAAPVVEVMAAAQANLSHDLAKDEQTMQLGPLIDRLEMRLGRGSVVRLESRASYIPERAGLAVSALDNRADLRHGEDVAPALDHQTTDGRIMPTAPGGARPLRLFPLPQVIEAMAEVPDGPPVMFRWRRLLHKVVYAEGPERIAPEWWRDVAPPGEDRSHLTRDYYRIEDTDGRRFWLYREGLYDLPTMPDAIPSSPRAPRWFLHGVFA